MTKALTISEVKNELSRFSKDHLVFIGDECITKACEFLSLGNDKQVELQLRWYSYVDEYIRTKKVSKEMRDFVQFFQIIIKTN